MEASPEPHIVAAIKSNRVEIVQLLLPIQRDMLDAGGKEPADHALEADSPDMWALFPDEIPDDVVGVHQKARKSSCVCLKVAASLIDAAEMGCMRCCYEFRGQMGKIVDDWTALMTAAYFNHPDIVRLVVRKEAGIQDSEGATALMISAQKGSAEVLELLVEYEAKMTKKTGAAALHIAALNGNIAAARLLIPHEQKMQDGEGFTALMNAAQEGHLEIARILAPLEAKMAHPDGWTAMMSAAIHNHAAIVQLLIPYEARMRTDQGESALQKAATAGSTEVVRVLAEHEARMQDEDGFSALMLAAQEGHTECVRALLPHEVKMTKPNGWTALMSAATGGDADIARLLLPHEAGCACEDGSTATSVAIFGYHLECLELLLENDAERDAAQIPEVMMSAYRGDVRDLLARQSEWQTTHAYLSVLDFALLGYQPRVAELLAGSDAAREFFVQQITEEFVDEDCGALRFLARHPPLFRRVLPVICSAMPYRKSGLIAQAVITSFGAARTLRFVCTPKAGSMFQSIGECKDAEQVADALMVLKNVGFSADGRTVLQLAKEKGGAAAEYLFGNPLKGKQVLLAAREATGKVPRDKQAAWREVDAETVFNGALFQQSRAALAHARPAFRRAQDGSFNQIWPKRIRVRCLLMESVRFMHRVVREMLDE